MLGKNEADESFPILQIVLGKRKTFAAMQVVISCSECNFGKNLQIGTLCQYILGSAFLADSWAIFYS